MFLDGARLTNSRDIANGFADFFESCYSSHDIIPERNVPERDTSFSLTSHIFAIEEIATKINLLDTNKSAGPDGITPLFLKNCCASLVTPLSLIFQKSFTAGYFPNIWKSSTLFPVFKSGSKSDIRNYRGISILSAIPKLFEAIISDELFNTYKNYIVPEQHGFFKGRSTTTNLAIYQDFLSTSIENGSQVDALYTDITKAFDSVCHRLLINQLCAIGINGNYLNWISSYLSGRRQTVIIGGDRSREICVTSGVPQGSHIGPILFSLFINDIVTIFSHSKCLLYADDLKFYSIINSNDDAENLQKDASNLSRWCERKLLQLNVSKCFTMRFYRKQNPIIFEYQINNFKLISVSTVNDLGVIFDRHLDFISHIDSITLKAFKMLGFIKRHSVDISNTQAISTLYSALVRSILEYNSVIWSPSYACHIKRLERVQGKFVNFLLYKFQFPCTNISTEIKRQLCGLPSLEVRRQNGHLFFLYKIINGIVDNCDLLNLISIRVPGRPTRSTHLFHVAPHRTNYGSSGIICRMQNLYNENFFEFDIFNVSLLSLKQKVGPITRY